MKGKDSIASLVWVTSAARGRSPFKNALSQVFRGGIPRIVSMVFLEKRPITILVHPATRREGRARREINSEPVAVASEARQVSTGMQLSTYV